MAHVITRSCCSDAACATVCPVDCIHPQPGDPDYEASEMLYIDPATCIDCGLCADECPVDAIYRADELPQSSIEYVDVNARYYVSREPLGAISRRFVPTTVIDEHLPVRVAIVGSGPAGCYTALELLRIPGIEVDVYDKLPTPWGLARAGVAPDHLDTKAVTRIFAEASGRQRMQFYLNVEVGRDVADDELAAHYDAIVYAIGAPDSRRLGIPGEDLPGSHSATEFVGWYNGHPDYAGLVFNLDSPRAVIVGNGNVAVDMARMLVSSPETLQASDIAEHALKALQDSRIRQVVVVGRRNVAHAACTTPELLALGTVAGIDVRVRPEDLVLTDVERAELKKSMASQNKYRVFQRLAQRTSDNERSIEFRFLESPQAIIGTTAVEGITLDRNVTRSHGNRSAVEPSGLQHTLPAGLVLRSIGFRARPAPGLPLDLSSGIASNASGRIVAADTGAPLHGRYVVGWIKRGASGAIGTNKQCAKQTVDALLEDLRAGVLPRATADRGELQVLLGRRCPNAVSWRQWRELDRHEQSAGARNGRPRRKSVDTRAMLRIAQRRAPRTDHE